MNRNTIRGLFTKPYPINIFSHKRRRQKLRELKRGNFRSAIIKLKQILSIKYVVISIANLERLVEWL